MISAQVNLVTIIRAAWSVRRDEPSRGYDNVEYVGGLVNLYINSYNIRYKIVNIDQELVPVRKF